LLYSWATIVFPLQTPFKDFRKRTAFSIHLLSKLLKQIVP
jgi:hypothetical protein